MPGATTRQAIAGSSKSRTAVSETANACASHAPAASFILCKHWLRPASALRATARQVQLQPGPPAIALGRRRARRSIFFAKKNPHRRWAGWVQREPSRFSILSSHEHRCSRQAHCPSLNRVAGHRPSHRQAGAHRAEWRRGRPPPALGWTSPTSSRTVLEPTARST